ncbi:hypothetical protein K239x_01070 [Planctomycetes bacterium K23_9]|uniref:Uncharacterized protein n=1 Tax=Stieleria marina TaxID=1930275 RepID=A0A517NM12_9BACT|nr:hypothetical protein K239x_01070 [Planctomycetes bacterium K23_9]
MTNKPTAMALWKTCSNLSSSEPDPALCPIELAQCILSEQKTFYFSFASTNISILDSADFVTHPLRLDLNRGDAVVI